MEHPAETKPRKERWGNWNIHGNVLILHESLEIPWHVIPLITFFVKYPEGLPTAGDYHLETDLCLAPNFYIARYGNEYLVGNSGRVGTSNYILHEFTRNPYMRWSKHLANLRELRPEYMQYIEQLSRQYLLSRSSHGIAL